MRQRVRRLGTLSLLVLLVALAATALAATAPADAERSTAERIGERPTRVLVVGDSVLEGAAAAIPAALAGREVVVDTQVSRSTASSVDAALAHGTDWDIVVVLLGHNDGGSPNAYQPAYRRLFDAFAGAPRIVPITIHEVRDDYPAVNAFLRAEAAARPNVRVLDWNALLADRPDATAGDGLHLSRAGADLMAWAVAGEVEAAEIELAPPPTTTTETPTTTAAPTTTEPPATTTTKDRATTSSATTSPSASTTTADRAALAAPVSPEPPADGAERWAWPATIAGFATLALVLRREHHLRRRLLARAETPGG